MLQLMGIDNRPRASCSDAIAAAVRDLLKTEPPTGLDLARYSYSGGRKVVTRPGGAPVLLRHPGLPCGHVRQAGSRV